MKSILRSKTNRAVRYVSNPEGLGLRCSPQQTHWLWVVGAVVFAVSVGWRWYAPALAGVTLGRVTEKAIALPSDPMADMTPDFPAAELPEIPAGAGPLTAILGSDGKTVLRREVETDSRPHASLTARLGPDGQVILEEQLLELVPASEPPPVARNPNDTSER